MSERQRPYTTDADPGDETPADDEGRTDAPPDLDALRRRGGGGERGMTEYDDLRALILEMDAVEFRVDALRGKKAGIARLQLDLPVETVRRFWAIAKALKAADLAPVPVQQPAQQRSLFEVTP